MKNLLAAILGLLFLKPFAQTKTAEFEGNQWNAPYTLNFPKGWEVERFLIPIAFAPQIAYRGVEDVRFTPGWGKAKSDDYWSYAFLWYVDDKVKTNAKITAKNLNAYYTGLVATNILSRNIAAHKVVPVKTDIKKIKKSRGDVKTFSGTIYMLDYMQQIPITLNCIVHLKFCTDQNKTFIFNEISPKDFNHPVWQSLNNLWTDFSCNKPVK